ncbi:type I secretion C-terminal target domain-containing protein [Shewanella surugensis]|uniref:Type I secretion C-terminal target domain-containing protein n=1 Tax=Shewanella surugensis TaxID=212020 RepID=A0ABT0LFJ1_9GAMM|nr:type I secretion C-terminal target domain-containing protein [Shewanella surugensis]MCL1126115.1 type I secretion C-terminal target domain-containing protein [Shewanella surugensis]
MSTFITKQDAIIKHISGLLKIKDLHGQITPLFTADYINAGEQIFFNDDSEFSLIFDNGEELKSTDIKALLIKEAEESRAIHPNIEPTPLSLLNSDDINSDFIQVERSANETLAETHYDSSMIDPHQFVSTNNVIHQILDDVETERQLNIELNNITENNVINTSEAVSSVNISENGVFNVDVLGSDLAHDTIISATLTSTDDADNSTLATANHAAESIIPQNSTNLIDTVDFSGNEGSDTFVLKAATEGETHIIGFDLTEDKLDISDILQNEGDIENLDNILHFSTAGEDTIIDIDSNHDGNMDQHLILDGIDLFASYSVNNDNDMINILIAEEHLIIHASSSTGSNEPEPLEDNISSITA